jgi:hypothetical protein
VTSKIFLAVAIIVDPADHSSADARGLRGGDQRCPDGNNPKPLLLGYASLSHDSDNQCRHFLRFPQIRKATQCFKIGSYASTNS